jgi:UDP-N-acetylmuramoyl-tripeptide--D-alanyl-D-alanine ligase
VKNNLKAVFIFYSPRFPKILVYMLQNTEYRAGPYLAWFWRTQNFSRVIARRDLVRTKAARLLTLALQLGMVVEILAGLLLIYLWQWHGVAAGLYFGLALILAYPIVWAHLVVLPLIVGREFSVKPKEQRLIKASEQIFKSHKGAKIAIAGSYGKTTMKELLVTVLGQGKKVAATPGNMNVPISHAHFAAMLSGDEDVLIIEYGEGAPGDVDRFARITHPTQGVITGVAPAHLDQYKTVEAAGEDIFSLAKYVKHEQLYVNDESLYAEAFIKKDFTAYDRFGCLGWKVEKVTISIDGVRFTLHKGKKELKLKSGLLGRHQLGPLTMAAALGHQFGLSDEQIIQGIADTKPFEHRMQPYLLAGAWVIDDTYNGNITGIRVGTELLKELPAKRKIYVTPGLVDQGGETEFVHTEMGRFIAAAEPDLVVLMKNSVTHFIQAGMSELDFDGETLIVDNPLEFYTNLEHFVAVGDLVMMQNDWTDNYA